MEENLRIIKTCRGGKKAIHKGYMYLKYRTGRKSIFWRCVKRNKCPSVMTTSAENHRAQVVIQKEHTHPPEWNSCEAAEFKYMAIERAITTGEPPELILQNLIESCRTESVANLPKLESIKRAIRRIKNKEVIEQMSLLKIQNTFSLNRSVNAKLASAYSLLRLLENEVSSIQVDIQNFISGNFILNVDSKYEDLNRRMGILVEHYTDFMEQIKINPNLRFVI